MGAAIYYYSPPLLLIYAAILLVLSCSSTTVHGGIGPHHHHHTLGFIPTTRSPPCKGSAAKCLTGDQDEFEFDSEISRRILATVQYISYGALQKNTVPCSRRGASYYNCQSGAQANPYSRSCSAITRCRS